MKSICEIKAGATFLYGGVEWVKLEMHSGGVLALAAAPVFDRAFDENNGNDWRESTLRKELNGSFFDKLVDAGADPAAFLEIVSDLTADDGTTDYGRATDRIALITCDLYRRFRGLIPKTDWWWTITPLSCDADYSYNARRVHSSGVLSSTSAYNGYGGVRPLCNLKSEIFVSIPGEEDDGLNSDAAHAEAVEDARAAIMDTLGDYPVEVWGDALGAAVASLFESKCAAEEMTEEETAIRRENE